jgi:hypothetical protein
MPEDYFGTTVALNANTALIGAAGSIDNTGSAFIFERHGTTWRQQARLTASDGQPGDTFGGAVALSADTALVGAGFANGNRGAVYVFTRLGQHWQPQARLTASDGASGDWFGHAVALSGNTALVGAWYADGLAGVVYVFARAAGRWTPQAKLTAGAGAGQAYFGSSVADNGSTPGAWSTYPRTCLRGEGRAPFGAWLYRALAEECLFLRELRPTRCDTCAPTAQVIGLYSPPPSLATNCPSPAMAYACLYGPAASRSASDLCAGNSCIAPQDRTRQHVGLVISSATSAGFHWLFNRLDVQTLHIRKMIRCGRTDRKA